MVAADWAQTALGTLGGVVAGLLIAGGGWWLNRRRLRRALALVLFYDAKAARLDWVQAVREGTPAFAPHHARLPVWRSLQHEAVDLFPRALVARLTELAWTMDRVLTGRIKLTSEGIDDAWALAARAERDLARFSGERLDHQTAEELQKYESRFGTKP